MTSAKNKKTSETMDTTINDIKHQLDRIESMTLIGAKNVLDFDETLLYTGLSRGHLYRLTSTRAIPHSKRCRKLYFDKAELDRWMLESRIPTQEEIDSQAATYVATHSRR